MAEHSKKHHHKRDSASIFKEKSLKSIARNKLIEKWLKRIMLAVTIVMGCLVVAAYAVG